MMKRTENRTADGEVEIVYTFTLSADMLTLWSADAISKRVSARLQSDLHHRIGELEEKWDVLDGEKEIE